MIIKRQQAEQLLAPRRPQVSPQEPEPGPLEPLAMETVAPHPPIEEEDPWTLEAMSLGLAPDRRKPQPERRQGIRRMSEVEAEAQQRAELEALKESAWQIGYADGFREAEGEIADLREQLSALLAGRKAALQSVSEEIGALAVAVAERILHVETACDPTLVEALVRDLLSRLPRDPSEVIVYIHPEAAASLRQALAQHPPSHLEGPIRVQEDPSQAPGGCRVETHAGQLDASLTTQLTVLKRLLGEVNWSAAPAPLPREEEAAVPQDAEKENPETLVPGVTEENLPSP